MTRRTILVVQEVCDDDSGMRQVGEIDSIPDGEVERYIRLRGEFGYQEILEFSARLTSAALRVIRDVRFEAAQNSS